MDAVLFFRLCENGLVDWVYAGIVMVRSRFVLVAEDLESASNATPSQKIRPSTLVQRGKSSSKKRQLPALLWVLKSKKFCFVSCHFCNGIT